MDSHMADEQVVPMKYPEVSVHDPKHSWRWQPGMANGAICITQYRSWRRPCNKSHKVELVSEQETYIEIFEEWILLSLMDLLTPRRLKTGCKRWNRC
ncbi:hypothetical protein Taro_056768 [Colocasia esculenta]|uniref:Uncharacterized protein n=1 Tax=Colocasia esculenta TaxID=4460 RepID=A0A843XXH8_COLES|nr:hypothetical protein [Colocasia esculenta]